MSKEIDWKKRYIILASDFNYAIGYIDGLDKPNGYLTDRSAIINEELIEAIKDNDKEEV